jgi:hypothetical protein
MAESHEESINLLIGALFEVYMELRDILLSLPIPLQMPTILGMQQVVILKVMQSVHRAAEVIQDQPLPTGVISMLTGTLHLWNAAAVVTCTAEENEGEPFLSAAGELISHVASGVNLTAHLVAGLPEADE